MWIDGATYTQLLEQWRMAPVGSPWFQDETGAYYQQVMTRKRREVGDAGHVSASKAVGWD